MHLSNDHLQDVLTLAEKSIEGQLTAEEVETLERYCSTLPDALRVYVDYCALHANLKLNRGQSQQKSSLLNIDLPKKPLAIAKSAKHPLAV